MGHKGWGPTAGVVTVWRVRVPPWYPVLGVMPGVGSNRRSWTSVLGVRRPPCNIYWIQFVSTLLFSRTLRRYTDLMAFPTNYLRSWSA